MQLLRTYFKGAITTTILQSFEVVKDALSAAHKQHRFAQRIRLVSAQQQAG